jgi:DNA-directed RNA polymerase subunit M/transcription elongation factor TFIIS
MHFCEKCGNMYYLKINDQSDKQLSFYCKNCGHQDDNLTTKTITILNSTVKNKQRNPKDIINKYTKLDPTLPRIKNIKCPNSKCKSRIITDDSTDDYDKEHEIIYIRYDNINMKYLYLCPTCDTVWKSSNN